MEEKELVSRRPETLSLKHRFIALLKSRNTIITILAVLIFTVLEFTTDFVEIVIGSAIEFTNPFRPKSGTIWDRHEKDQIASEQLEAISKSIPDEQDEIPDIRDSSQLQKILDEQETVMIGAEQFRNVYNQIPTRFSYQIIPPFDLLKLAHSRKWIWTKVIKGENNLAFHFLDGDKQFLMDTYPPLAVLYEISDVENTKIMALDSIDIFIGRTITREQFFNVFDDLSNSMKLRLINNPFQLVKWDRNIRKVGISRYAIGNIVTIGFEIDQGNYTEIYSFEASDLAADNFIERLNKLYPALNLDYPEDKYSDFPDHF